MEMQGSAERLRGNVIDDARSRVAALLDQYELSLYSYLLALTHDRDIARDCLQQTFLAALEHLRKGRDVNSSWLYKVARSRGIDELRRNRRVAKDSVLFAELPVPQPSAQSTDVQRVLAQMRPEEREILYLYDVDGFSAKEIGAMLGTRVNAVRMRVLRARERFRAIYAAGGRAL
jgi:RNA polymerase sigma-70 factor (ECF subfamily)